LNKVQPFINPVHPDDRQKVMDWGPTLKSIKQPFEYEYRIIREDGSIRHICDRGYQIMGKDGEVKLFVGTGRDVTEWRHAEKALRESKEYLNQIINCIGDPVIVKDRAHKLVLVNDAFCTFNKMRREDLIGTTGFERFPPEVELPFWKDEEEIFRRARKQTEDINQFPGQPLTFMTKSFSRIRTEPANDNGYPRHLSINGSKLNF
jgi:PAS domain-containing protein